MRYLVISDIHGNLHALEAVLCDARPTFDQLLCLGDVVGYGAYPNECCEILQEWKADTVMGNHDAAVLGIIATAQFKDVARDAVKWTQDCLSRENWLWLNRVHETVDKETPAFQATHGSLQDPYYCEYIFDIIDSLDTFDTMKYPLCFFGHTHRSGYFRQPLSPSLATGIESLPLPHGGAFALEKSGCKYLVNPGSCGQPRDGNPQARYIIYDTINNQIEIRAVEYDIKAAAAAIVKAGLPRPLADRLAEGR